MSVDGIAALATDENGPAGVRPCVQRALVIRGAWDRLVARSSDGQTVSTGIVDLERTQTCLLRTVIELVFRIL